MATFINIFDSLVDEYHKGGLGTFDERSYAAEINTDVHKILTACILSSAWTFEKAIVAATLVVDEWNKARAYNCDLQQIEIEALLRSPSIRHRFPKTRADQVAKSLARLGSIGVPLQFFSEFPTACAARAFTRDAFPGLGMKQSSMFLRDIGVGHNLAVIDVHILWYLRNVESISLSISSDKGYLKVEDCLRGISSRLGLGMQTLDRLIWISVREFRRIKRVSTCGMQYALPLEA